MVGRDCRSTRCRTMTADDRELALGDEDQDVNQDVVRRHFPGVRRHSCEVVGEAPSSVVLVLSKPSPEGSHSPGLSAGPGSCN
jgi:hypothetical protein